ncbi:MAG: YicC family protein [Peptococcaceae bacterium]|nr:YicC family protein [Peptococcaceae bacterium]
MANSMTGFGRGETRGHGYSFSIEMKSVNHRFLEVVVKLPRYLNVLEENVRKIIQERVSRGRIEVYINTKETEEKKRLVKVDKELTLSYDNSLKELAQLLNSAYITDIYRLVALPEILTVEEEETDAEVLWPFLEAAVLAALQQLVQMRRDEGERLLRDLRNRIGYLRDLTKKVEERAPEVVVEYQEKLKERLSSLLADTTLDESRLAMEVALLADRASITEELVRMGSHLDEFEKTLQSSESIGRKLDFLVQEMNREINTIGSKANDLVISRIVVEGKSELEKIREQIQNIE